MVPALVVLLAVVGVYMQSLGGTFVWDDRLLVLDAPLVEKTASLGEYLQHPFWMGGGAQPRDPTYYRPLVTLSLALDHRLHGSNPGGYHLTNIALHAASALLLLALLRRGGVRAPVATLVATSWALLPRLAEAAAWISGRTDLFATVFALAALLVWAPGLGRRLLAAALLGLAFLAKESALAFVPALAISEWVRAAPARPRVRLPIVLGRTLPLIAIVALYLALRYAMVGHASEGPPLGVGLRALTVLHSVGTYTQMLLDAWRPRAVIGRVGVVAPLSIAIGALTLLGLILALVKLRRRLTPDTALGFALAGFALLPVLHLFPLPIRTLAADRFLYLPTAGLALGCAYWLERALGRSRPRWAAAILVALSLAVTTFHRVGVWSDELEFWITTYLETPPINVAPATELFGVYYRGGQYPQALELAERGLRYDDPNKKDPRYNSALALSRMGRREEARARFLASRSKHRRNDDIDLVLAIMAIQTGETEFARVELDELARRGDRRAAWMLSRLPELVEARAALVALGPDSDPERRARLATLVGDDARATQAWTELAASPQSAKTALHDGLSYLVLTGHQGAIEAVARAHLARFGPIEPHLADMIEVRLTEIERLTQARSRLGL
jgi:tetratricopeptide (TPR) repeat protein